MGQIDFRVAARVAEIIASIAVVISLVIVVFSIKQNTVALQSSNDNFLYEVENQRLRDVYSDPELNSIILRYYAGEELSPEDESRYRHYATLYLNIWDIAFTRHKAGQLPIEQWSAWNRLMEANVPTDFREEWWLEERYAYSPDFAEHVDAAYARQR